MRYIRSIILLSKIVIGIWFLQLSKVFSKLEFKNVKQVVFFFILINIMISECK